MASLHIGSDELVYIQTEKVSLTMKGPAAHPSFQGITYQEGESTLRVSCSDDYQLSLKGCDALGVKTVRGGRLVRDIYNSSPVF